MNEENENIEQDAAAEALASVVTPAADPTDYNAELVREDAKPEGSKKTVEIKGQRFTEEEIMAALNKTGPSATHKLIDKVTPSGCMREATVWLKRDKLGNNCELLRVTPAELLYLVAGFHPQAGGDPIQSLEETGFVRREVEDEKERLMMKYGYKFNEMFPDAMPTFPESFERAIRIGLRKKVADGQLAVTNLTA